MSKIKTLSGHYLDFADPKPESIELRDIAWGLAGVRRFASQTPKRWNVAQHSLLVHRIVESKNLGWHAEMAALLHDAQEAYMGDVPTPLKDCIQGYREIEARVQHAIRVKLGLVTDEQPCLTSMESEVKKADKLAYHVESWRLRGYPDDEGKGLDLGEFLSGLDHFDYLWGSIGTPSEMFKTRVNSLLRKMP